MDDPNIDYLLEFLVRLYSIDSYNTEELILLLIPFGHTRYEEQLKRLIKYHESKFSSLVVYTPNEITTVIIKDQYLFRSFLNYFIYYKKFKTFLDLCLDELSNKLKNSKTNYLSEFMVIFDKLEENNEREIILKTYKPLKFYFKSDEFEEYIKKFLS